MNPLKQLEACGQAPWLDFLKRSLVQSGELQTLIDRDGLKGLTSNPSIFQKAIGEGEEYAGAIRDFLNTGDHSLSDIYEHLAIADIQAAADVLRPVYEKSEARDGYVSLECSPYLANDTEATLVEARRLWAAVDRPNLMVKVPATPAGIPAIRQLIGEGININITLLFAVEVYEQVVEAYVCGLEDLQRAGGDVARIGSVASFFISRIDSAVEKSLNALDDTVADELRGKVAIASAKIAYARYQALFSGPRWQALSSIGAQTQRLLWASTSTKNKHFRDTLYVEDLIGRDTVDTIPPATMDAFRDHGQVKPDGIEADVDSAHAVLATLKAQGIALGDITDALVAAGVQQFADAFDRLFLAIANHRKDILGTRQSSLSIEEGSVALTLAVDAELEAWRQGGRIRRLWAGDKSLWSGADEDKWGGWLTVIDAELAHSERLRDFAAWVQHRGFTDVLLLGMGGSSLGPEVLAETFGNQTGWPEFHMLDSTDPKQIKEVEAAVDLGRTLIIVSSKSGGTLEPNIFMAYFLDRLATAVGKGKAPSHFVAVTDPGSSLDQQARTLGFAHIFYGVPSIGGRYSVLSKFGLVPAAAMGLDFRRLLQSARPMQIACGPDAPPDANPGVQLGVALGIAASQFGRDKVTIITAPAIADLGAWLEQLLAESTGKLGRGLIPVAGEPLAVADRYGDDRFFVYLGVDGQNDDAQRRAVLAMAKAGHPVACIMMPDILSLGQEFFRWEVATAVAGAIIGINPFDQPDVEASKIETRGLTEAYEKSHTLPGGEPVFRQNGLALYTDPGNADHLGRHNTVTGYLKSHLGRVKNGDYVALLAYVDRDPAHIATLTQIRESMRDHTKAATCVGFGPRFQHSTGQAYKGGPNSGVFLQITCDDPEDIDVPGHAYSFGVVKAAQAAGDFKVLVDRGRRALRVHLKHVDTGLPQLASAIDSALDELRSLKE
jgi:transaldolase/glucose-6-phosphate isomerase